jgi:hypothetical protein
VWLCGQSIHAAHLPRLLPAFHAGKTDAEATAEVESRWTKRQAADGGPEVKLMAAPITVKALEEIMRDVN